jgi:hypothetical protein
LAQAPALAFGARRVAHIFDRERARVMADQDKDLLNNIDALIDEEHALRERAASNMGLSPAEKARLGELEVRLDRCWDLLRQRRARSEFGQNPEGAHLRSATEVESYEN